MILGGMFVLAGTVALYGTLMMMFPETLHLPLPNLSSEYEPEEVWKDRLYGFGAIVAAIVSLLVVRSIAMRAAAEHQKSVFLTSRV